MHDVLERFTDRKIKTSALSLAPSLLLRPAAFLWLWTLPLAVLLAINFQGYWLVEGNLNPDQRNRAILLGVAGALNFSLSLAAYLSLKLRGEKHHETVFPAIGWSVTVIALQVAYLWFALSSVDELLPRSVTSWIYPAEHFLFNQFAFGMMPAFFGVFLIAAALPVKHLGNALARNVGLVVGVPIAVYVAAQAVWAFKLDSHFSSTLVATGLVAMSILMFIGLVRALLLGLRLLQPLHVGGELAVIVVFALVLPLGGLILNRLIPFPEDFQAREVYALVVANAAILFFASLQRTHRPVLSFALLCTTFPFSLYFFVVFLPYIPLSLPAIIVMGAGFLVLAPIILCVLHFYLLCASRRCLASRGNPSRLTLLGLACGLALPAFFTVRAVAEKAALNAALNYLYNPAVKSENLVFRSSLPHLRRALSGHRAYKNGIYYPLLSDYYSWLVFDNLVLPDDKLARLENTFLGSSGSAKNTDPLRQSMTFFGNSGSVRQRSHMPRSVQLPRTVEVAHLDLQRALSSVTDTSAIVTLALELKNIGPLPAEYLQTLPLPPGIFVKGFRLSVNGALKPGRLFEKKSALWVYTMIRDSERRDPGILFYTTPNELELRVFPVATDQVTTVEIDFLLPEAGDAFRSTTSTNDPALALAELGKQIHPQLVNAEEGAVATGAWDAEALPAVECEPYLHLIIDRSENNNWEGDLPAVLRDLRKKFPTAGQARVTLANFEVVDAVRSLTLIAELIALPPMPTRYAIRPSGGFALDLALAHALRQHRDLDLDTPAIATGGHLPKRPVFIVLSRSTPPAKLDLPLTEKWTAFLGSLDLYQPGPDGALVALQINQSPATPFLRLGSSTRPLLPAHAARFKTSEPSDRLEYWSPTDAAWKAEPGVHSQPKGTVWSQAQSLQIQEQNYACSPGESASNQRKLVKVSRESGILLPNTSYIVVENSAQWRKLELSEQRKIGQNVALEFLETPAPPELYVGLGFGLWLTVRRWRASSRRRKFILMT